MLRGHVDTGSVDREDVKRDCTKALEANIAYEIKYLQRKAMHVIFPQFEMNVQELVGK